MHCNGYTGVSVKQWRS